MFKRVRNDRRAVVIFSLAGIALAASATSFAGPGCMGNQRSMAPGYYPGSPMLPPAVYRPGPPAAYRAGPAPYRGMMAPYNRRPMADRQFYPGIGARPTAAKPAGAVTEGSALQAAGSGDRSGGENITVRINGMQFEPASISVKPGTTVTWIHSSSMPHTVTGRADGLRSSTLQSGQQFSHTFEATGRYDYACDFHPSMKGSVIVETVPTEDT